MKRYNLGQFVIFRCYFLKRSITKLNIKELLKKFKLQNELQRFKFGVMQDNFFCTQEKCETQTSSEEY